MRKLNQVLAGVAGVLLVPLVASTSAAAVATCDIGYTAPNSQNMCTSLETYQCSVKSTNTVEIKNSTDQVVASGSVGTGGNTTAGSSTSGSVTNTNGTTFTVTITNPAPGTGTGDLGTCVATVTVPAKETPEVVQPTKTVATTVEALPVTSGSSMLVILATTAASIVVGTILAVAGLVVYRHFRA